MAKHFLIYTNQHKDSGLGVTNRIREYLENRGQRVSLRIKTADWKEKVSEPDMEFPEDVDCMLVLGGDGTVLEAVRETEKRPIPLVGVNLGTLGFMAQVETAGLESALDRLICGDYHQEKRMMLQGNAQLAGGEQKEGFALNDIVIARSGSLRIIQLRIYVNGLFLHEYQADGIIVTTPTGSTGYNLSAGGPLVEPSAQLMVLTPICPHTLNQRSIILSAEDEVEIEIPGGKEGKSQTVEASFDGAGTFSMSTGDRIKIVKSKESAEFIQLGRESFLEILHKKMNE